jgi:hypothetical protein
MDRWRIALLLAVAVFALFLLAKMRPRISKDDDED